MIKEILLSHIDKENLFLWKKADILLKINVIFFCFILFIVIPVHCTALYTKPLLITGDLLLLIGMILSFFLIRSGKVFSAGMVTIFALMQLPLVHNTFGDWLTPNNPTYTRYFETLLITCFLFPVITVFTVNKKQLVFGALLSIIDVVSHFYVLKHIVGVDIPTTYLVYLVMNIILGMVGYINHTLANEAIETLSKSKDQIKEWNSTLEKTIEIRTKELVESNNKLETISNTDGLTGIANRRKFDMHYASEWNRAKRNGTSLAIFLIDLDQFKLYNDSFGHLQGDECLKLVAQSLTACFHRTGELVARYGGEEFVIVLPCVSASDALNYGEKLRSNMETLSIQHAPNANYKVMTLSIGITARTLSSGDTPEAFLKEADDALYSAKKLGRNRVEMAKCLDTN